MFQISFYRDVYNIFTVLNVQQKADDYLSNEKELRNTS